MRTQITAPAHTDGCKYRNGITVGPSFGNEARHQAQRCTYCTQSCNRESYQVWILETEQPLEHHVNLTCQVWQQLDTFVSLTVVCTVRRTECQDHHQSRDNQHTRNNGHTYIYTGLSTIQQSIQCTDKHRLFFYHFLFISGKLVITLNGIFFEERRISLHHEALHQTGRNDTTDKRPYQTNERFSIETLSHHEHNHQQAHTKSRTEVGQRNVLVLLEITAETLVLRKRDDSRIIGQESHYRPQGRYTRQVEQRTHQRTKDTFQQLHHAKFHKNLTDSTGNYTDCHQIETSVQQQVVCCLHNGVQHLWHTHLHTDECKQAKHNYQARNAVGNVLPDSLFLFSHNYLKILLVNERMSIFHLMPISKKDWSGSMVPAGLPFCPNA